LSVAVLKGKYIIWLKRYGYKNIILDIDRQHDPNITVDRLQVTEERVEERFMEERTQAAMDSLVKDEELDEIKEDFTEGNELGMDNLIMEEEPPIPVEMENEYRTENDVEKPYVVKDDQELNEIIKVRSVIAENIGELMWHLDQVAPSWKEPISKERNPRGSRVFHLFNSLLADKHEPVNEEIKMVIVVLQARQEKNNFSPNPWILDAMLTNLERI
jgi:hypothetical protein